jgi:hypothetical protein
MVYRQYDDKECECLECTCMKPDEEEEEEDSG